MVIEKLRIKNFRCFGSDGVNIRLGNNLTALVGDNGSGKTAAFLALSRLFGVTPSDRAVRKQDFHVGKDISEVETGTALSIEVVFGFPELSDSDDIEAINAVPEFFSQMAASAPGAPLKARMRLEATWTDDGTPYGSIEEDLRWVTTLDEEYDWDSCTHVQAVERGSIQLIYLPASRNAAKQATALLKGRLWRAARWSDSFRDKIKSISEDVQQEFELETAVDFVLERLTKRWRQVHAQDTYSEPNLRLIESRFEALVRNVEITLSPDEAGYQRTITDLSDGQHSLFHIALTAATLEIERDALTQAAGESAFDRDKLRQANLTFLVVEEPENNLSPFYLSRVIKLAREIGKHGSAQVAISSHSPAILSRIEPEEVRYFRLDQDARSAIVQEISMPENDEEASRYVRLAVRSYPELYFARFVILCEGDSERLVIPRVADAIGVQLDPSFVPVVPLGGRYVDHFWKLLNDLGIPHATLLDLDLGRKHGGANLIKYVVEKLMEFGNDMSNNPLVESGTIDPANVGSIEDKDLMDRGLDHPWLQALREERIFFSYPLDIDFAMLKAFPSAYQHTKPGGTGPRSDSDEEAKNKKKLTTLKTGGIPELYDESYDDEFMWYPYLFLNRSKPETHIAALARIDIGELATNAPTELDALIRLAKETLGLEGDRK